MAKNSLTILADENMPAVEALFGPYGKIIRASGRDLTAEQLAGVDILLVRSITQVNEQLLAGSQVQFVGSATIGTDHIDLAYLQQRAIGFANAPGCNAEGVVDYVLANLWRLLGQELLDKTVGIVGVGNVGGRLARRLEALGVKLLLNDPPRARAGEQGFVELAQVLEQAEVICCHTPLTRSGELATEHLIGAEELAKLQPNTILLNAGRGPVIDNAALLAHLQQQPEQPVVLDVWEAEPKVDSELAALVQIGSPHIAGYSLEGKVRGSYMLWQQLGERMGWQTDKPLSDFLPKPAVTHISVESSLDIGRLIRLVYDVREDDLRFRESLHYSDQPQRFDALRKYYPVRREFNSLQVSCSDSLLAQQLAALGFSLKH